MTITKPSTNECPAVYKQYIDQTPENDLLYALQKNKERVLRLVEDMEEGKADHRYADNKWSVKEVLAHIVDSERIFAYRALRFARNDQSPLAGFDEEKYSPESNAVNRTLESIVDEFHKVRDATIALFNSFTPEMMQRKGTANNNQVSVRALGFIIPGHTDHHLNVIRQKYLSQRPAAS